MGLFWCRTVYRLHQLAWWVKQLDLDSCRLVFIEKRNLDQERPPAGLLKAWSALPDRMDTGRQSPSPPVCAIALFINVAVYVIIVSRWITRSSR
jgi:hypothetical protein